MRTRNRKGFTLIEVGAAISILGIMAAILLPTLARAREASRRTSCAANLMQLGMAAHLYAMEHDRLLPWSGGNDNAECLRWLYYQYIGVIGAFQCPSTHFGTIDEAEGRLDELNTDLRLCDSLRSSYDYLGAYSYAPIRLPHPSRPAPPLPLFWDGVPPDIAVSYPNHVSGVNVVFLDGHSAWIANDQFSAPGLPVAPLGIDLMPPAEAWEAAVQRPGWGDGCR